ncbi:xylulose 5-phosphate 3-epimerase [Marinobacter lutaoensis]|jgi:phosphoketolase|uniref:xylulose 5-phosphate 3-epimerase n=1 Tax=Marinobacter lutaoensis TaxID=135739 RepID=UPI000C4CE8D5|nr:xylulose 5-phosphate 3-epimerase [Marinobacter lutaoensis]MBI43121.1 xylulose 5-phosphate 3-epimerase [Oceanospirillales bacterium]NVD36928.1 xylulose 5-phosphate 3-epimerase [Marinobacter lutaoensis]
MPSPTRSKPAPSAGVDTPEYERWRRGYGVIRHSDLTCAQVRSLAARLVRRGLQPDEASVYRALAALDRLTSAGLWLVAHMTYARRVHAGGDPLERADFKAHPEGHTGGALNMVPAYAAYLALNRLTGTTRSWLMGQGHCAAAVEALNVLTDNLHPEQRARYRGPRGWSQLVSDFHSQQQDAHGRPAAPLGSHITAHTAGAVLDGAYPGSAELQYVHMPLPGEALVAFLSDGALEAQPGYDQAPRWWHPEDCGLVMPVVVANGQRLDRRVDLGTRGGLERFERHLVHRGFEPIRFDGRDPAAYVCTLEWMERTLAERSRQASAQVRLPFGIAETRKGFGFFPDGEDPDLPLPGNPSIDARARELFQRQVAPLWVSPSELDVAVRRLAETGRPERDHPLAHRDPARPVLPVLPPCRDPLAPPLAAVDHFFTALTAANPGLRPRVANLEDVAGRRLPQMVAALQYRAPDPDPPRESPTGRIITTGHAEAALAACLANQAGLNLVLSYEAAGPRMFGLLHQALRFTRQRREAGRPARWLGLAVVACAHTWESSRQGQAHQDTSLAEGLLTEGQDVARVLFPADYNSTLAVLPEIYRERGRITGLVVPERQRPTVFDASEADVLARQGALVVDEDVGGPGEPLLLIASGAYQLSESIRACERLRETGTPFRLVYLQDPGRFRQARDAWEAPFCATEFERERLFPHRMQRRVAVTHLRPEVFRGHLHPLFPDPAHSRVLGYGNRGGTLNEAGLLFANGCSWGHILLACAAALETAPEVWLSAPEREAVGGHGDPTTITRGLPAA